MLEYLFSNKNVEKLLMYLCLHEKVNASELSTTFKTSLDPIQKTLRKLEARWFAGKFLGSENKGISIESSLAFLEEIQALAKKAYSSLPSSIQKAG